MQETGVICEDGAEIPVDAVLWVTQASAPDWLADAGLAAAVVYLLVR